jgi:integrase
MVAEVSKGNMATGTETVGELIAQWLDHIEADRSPTTMRKYRDIADRVVVPELGKIKLRALTSRQLDLLYSKLTAKGNKATTVRRVHALISAALHQAERWDLVDRNASKRATPPIVRTAQVEAPSLTEVQAILTEAERVEPMMAVLLLLAALTGGRRGELCALRWTDLDTTAGTLTIARSVYEAAGGGWSEKGTKTHQARTIGLDDLGQEALSRHRKAVDVLADGLGLDVPPDAFMFSRSPVGSEPIRPDVVTKTFTALCRRMEKPVLEKLRKTKPKATRADLPAADRWDYHLHGLRHFSASQAIAAGFDPVTVGGRLGHADPSITLRVYSHVLEQRDRELAAALGKTLALAELRR